MVVLVCLESQISSKAELALKPLIGKKKSGKENKNAK
jgi:hypothetical protein